MKNIVRWWIAVTVCFAVMDAGATILTFNGISVPNDTTMPGTYGDNVSSTGPDANGHTYGMGNAFTPKIQLAYGPGTSVRYYNDASWPTVAYLTGVAANDFTFTPDPGYGVKINSFNLIDYPSFGGGHTNTWTIYKDVAGGTVLASGTVTVPPNTTTSVTTGFGGYMGTTILRITQVTQERTDDLALDNLNFDQIPEPSTIALLSLGGLLVLRKRKV